MLIRLAIAALTCAVLTGCATLNESECRTGDWYGIGLRDGAEGRLTSHLSNHAKACADYGIAPNASLWLAGREDGLVSYCTPGKAYREGRSGRAMRPVCPAEVAVELDRANLFGLRYHELSNDIEDAERDLYEIRTALSDLSPEDPAYSTLLRQKSRTILHIQRLKSRRLRYAVWP
ncbi:MAG: DUF2799 domain-containing protein [Pseudomonadota bacterium]